MIPKNLFISIVLFCSFLLPTAKAQQQEEQNQSSVKVISEAKIVGIAQPDIVKTKRKYGPPYISDDKAPDNYKWLYLMVKINVPS